jgi:hypothetical protein
MIALSSFIVITDDPFAWTPVEEGVFQSMRPFERHVRQPPYPDLNDRAIVERQFLVFNQPRGHMLTVAYVNKYISTHSYA